MTVFGQKGVCASAAHSFERKFPFLVENLKFPIEIEEKVDYNISMCAKSVHAQGLCR